VTFARDYPYFFLEINEHPNYFSIEPTIALSHSPRRRRFLSRQDIARAGHFDCPAFLCFAEP
jgi:hypothetical protein